MGKCKKIVKCDCQNWILNRKNTLNLNLKIIKWAKFKNLIINEAKFKNPSKWVKFKILLNSKMGKLYHNLKWGEIFKNTEIQNLNFHKIIN